MLLSVPGSLGLSYFIHVKINPGSALPTLLKIHSCVFSGQILKIYRKKN